MPAILALVLKDWKYFLVIGFLLGAVGYIYHCGETHIEAADAKVAAAQIVHNTEVDNVVKTKVAAAVAEYDALAPIPVPAVVPRLVCFAPGSSSVLQGARPSSGGVGTGASVPLSATPSGQGFDPAAAVSADGSAADAEIAHLLKKVDLLQGLVHAYQDAGIVAK